MTASTSIVRRIDDSGIPLLVIRLILGGLFIYTGVQKIADPVDFLKEIREYHLVPESPAIFLNSLAIILPWLEVLCGVLLVAGACVRGSAGLIALMFLGFTPAILLRAMAVHAHEGTPFLQIAFDCGCGTGVVIIWKKLLSNLSLLGLSILVLLSRSRRFCLMT